MTKAFEMGFMAGYFGHQPMNPFSVHVIEHDDWDSGYYYGEYYRPYNKTIMAM